MHFRLDEGDDVFKDPLLSRHNETYWRKPQTPYDTNNELVLLWRIFSKFTACPSITNRLEHTAIVDQFGSMYIWGGGRFQTVSWRRTWNAADGVSEIITLL